MRNNALYLIPCLTLAIGLLVGASNCSGNNQYPPEQLSATDGFFKSGGCPINYCSYFCTDGSIKSNCAGSTDSDCESDCKEGCGGSEDDSNSSSKCVAYCDRYWWGHDSGSWPNNSHTANYVSDCQGGGKPSNYNRVRTDFDGGCACATYDPSKPPTDFSTASCDVCNALGAGCFDPNYADIVQSPPGGSTMSTADQGSCYAADLCTAAAKCINAYSNGGLKKNSEGKYISGCMLATLPDSERAPSISSSVLPVSTAVKAWCTAAQISEYQSQNSSATDKETLTYCCDQNRLKTADSCQAAIKTKYPKVCTSDNCASVSLDAICPEVTCKDFMGEGVGSGSKFATCVTCDLASHAKLNGCTR